MATACRHAARAARASSAARWRSARWVSVSATRETVAGFAVQVDGVSVAGRLFVVAEVVMGEAQTVPSAVLPEPVAGLALQFEGPLTMRWASAWKSSAFRRVNPGLGPGFTDRAGSEERDGAVGVVGLRPVQCADR
jgi:hypothetical protein